MTGWGESISYCLFVWAADHPISKPAGEPVHSTRVFWKTVGGGGCEEAGCVAVRGRGLGRGCGRELDLFHKPPK